ncbi:uncharacterized protein LOC135396730 [Ornithodoros turicata]|uniref:uncharacterized protein LOC135396730 n=1 Tax=Ornithodoros turicata TaxID=34597 RepID=UPI0031390D15
MKWFLDAFAYIWCTLMKIFESVFLSFTRGQVSETENSVERKPAASTILDPPEETAKPITTTAKDETSLDEKKPSEQSFNDCELNGIETAETTFTVEPLAEQADPIRPSGEGPPGGSDQWRPELEAPAPAEPVASTSQAVCVVGADCPPPRPRRSARPGTNRARHVQCHSSDAPRRVPETTSRLRSGRSYESMATRDATRTKSSNKKQAPPPWR